MTTGRALPPGSAFSQDDGSVDPRLEHALSRFSSGAAQLTEVVTVLATTRVLIPVMAELDVAEVVNDQVSDKEASAGVVAIETSDGRRALPVFSSVAAMKLWRKTARPVPVDVPRAALSAVSEDWSLLILDPAGPVPAAIPRPAVWALAQAHEWKPAIVSGVVDDEVASAIIDGLADIPAVRSVRAEPGRQAEIAVVLAIESGLDRAGLDATLALVNARLGAVEVIGARVDSLELRIGSAK